jgi:hypothetical protein
VGIIKYTAPAAEISGTIGGVTYFRSHDTKCARLWRAPADKQTEQQRARRNWMARFSAEWFNTLTAAQRTAWDTYAPTVTFTDPLGTTYTINGFNMFLRTQLLLIPHPTGYNYTAPVGTGLPTSRTFTFTFTHATGAFQCASLTPAGLAADRILSHIYFYDRVTRNHKRLRHYGWSDVPGNQAVPFGLATYSPTPGGAAGTVKAWVDMWYLDSDNRITHRSRWSAVST